jgi:hypothetical protein
MNLRAGLPHDKMEIIIVHHAVSHGTHTYRYLGTSRYNIGKLDIASIRYASSRVSRRSNARTTLTEHGDAVHRVP